MQFFLYILPIGINHATQVDVADIDNVACGAGQHKCLYGVAPPLHASMAVKPMLL